jgi:hypothetical protein
VSSNLISNALFPATIHLWNDLPQYIRDSPSNCILISRLKTYYNNPVKPSKYFLLGSRLRQNCSSLKGDLFRCNLIDSCYCNYANYVENNEHYFLHCELFVNQRNVMLNNIRDLGLDISINNILYGNSDSEYDVNCTLFAAVHRYIMDTKRFD